VETMPPRTPGVCDDCGSGLVQREDDTEPVVRKRYETYHQQTEPLAGYYHKQGKLAKVDAALPLEERLAATVAALD
jgi:adenylate kinase